MFDYQCQLESVTDGDTVRLTFDHGMYLRSSQALRLLGVFAPERFDPGGPETRDVVAVWMSTHQHTRAIGRLTWPYRVVTQKDKQTFNRYIGVVTCGLCGSCLNVAITDYLATAGWGGGTGST